MFFILLIFALVWNESRAALECRIYSNKYGDYLYAKSKFLGFGSQRKVSLTSEKYTGTDYLLLSKKDPSGIWYLEPIEDAKDAFILRNKKYNNEYLRGSDSFQDMFFKKNRDVNVEKIDWQDVTSFIWRLENERTNLFHITNMKWNLPLCAKEYLASINSRKLRLEKSNMVSLTSDKSGETNPANFEWFLKCQNSH